MPVFSKTLNKLIEITAESILGDWYSGTCAANTSTTSFVDSSCGKADDYWQNTVPPSRIRILTTTDGATPIGQERTISDWVLSTTTGTVSAAFTAAPTTSDTYCIMSEYTWEELRKNINMAIDAVAKDAVFEAIDTSTVMVTDIFEYPLPADFAYIYRISQEVSGGSYADSIPPDQYRIIRGSAPARLHFYQFPIGERFSGHYYGELWANADLAEDMHLRIEGYALQSQLVAGTDLCHIDPVYVCYQAAAYAHARRIRRAENEPDEHRTQYQVCQALADRNLPKGLTQWPPNVKRVFE